MDEGTKEKEERKKQRDRQKSENDNEKDEWSVRRRKRRMDGWMKMKKGREVMKECEKRSAELFLFVRCAAE